MAQKLDPGSDRSIPAAFIQTMLVYTAKMKPYRTSMKIDYDEQRPLEVEAIFGNPLHMAQQAGLQLPRIEMLYQQLKFLDERNRVHHLS
jgi:2-dehydropantoate 2-reductase